MASGTEAMWTGTDGMGAGANGATGYAPYAGQPGVPEAITLGLPTVAASLPAEPVDRDRLLLEHLPTVRYVARRIHERLPRMWNWTT